MNANQMPPARFPLRAASLHPGPRRPAEQEQRDVLNPDPPSPGDQRVGQFMDEDRSEEQDRRQDGDPGRGPG